MNRRDFIRNGLCAGAGYALAGSIHGAVTLSNNQVGTRSGQRRPNIILLLTDDQPWNALGCMGNTILKTPNIDHLAGTGVVFSNAYVTTSICMSSRASIILGQYMRRHGIERFNQSLTPRQFSQTYTALLRSAGYRTGFIGKHGLASFPAGEFDYYKGFDGQGTYSRFDRDGNPIHSTALMADQAVEFLQESRQDVPFCLSISFKAPHVEGLNEFRYDVRYEDLYQDVTIPFPVTYDDRYWNVFPERFRKPGGVLNEGRSRWNVRFSTPQRYQDSVKAYFRLITGVDVAVGTILGRLAELGFDDNTIIVFSSDNGFYLAEHGLAGKWYGHEPSIRVPLIVYDPRLPQQGRGRRLADMALNIDIAPTLLSYAGLPIPAGMQGRDLARLIDGQVQDWRTGFLYEQMYDNGGNIPKCEGVVESRYKYFRFFALGPVYEQLFDIETDPHEMTNLATDPDYAELLQQMRDRCDQLILESA